jgi:hypothetical protein
MDVEQKPDPITTETFLQFLEQIQNQVKIKTYIGQNENNYGCSPKKPQDKNHHEHEAGSNSISSSPPYS